MKNKLLGALAFLIFAVGLVVVLPLMQMADPEHELRITKCYNLCEVPENDPAPEAWRNEPRINVNGGGVRCGCKNERSYYITGKDEYSETTDNWFFK